MAAAEARVQVDLQQVKEREFSDRVSGARQTLEEVIGTRELNRVRDKLTRTRGATASLDDVAKARLHEIEVGVAECLTIEGKGKLIADTVRLRSALDQYQTAVNAFWLYAEQQGITAYIVRSWAARHRRALARAAVERDELEAEATMAMRDQVVRWRPDGGASFRTFASRGIGDALNVYVGRAASAVTLPREKVRRLDGEVFNRGEFPQEDQD
jgi:hypothetical protein